MLPFPREATASPTSAHASRECWCHGSIYFTIYGIVTITGPSVDLFLISRRSTDSRTPRNENQVYRRPSYCDYIWPQFDRHIFLSYGHLVNWLIAYAWWRHQREHFPRYWPFVRGIHWSPVNSPYKGQWRWALMSSLICARISGWVNNGEAGDLRRHHAHYDVNIMDWRNNLGPTLQTMMKNCMPTIFPV